MSWIIFWMKQMQRHYGTNWKSCMLHLTYKDNNSIFYHLNEFQGCFDHLSSMGMKLEEVLALWLLNTSWLVAKHMLRTSWNMCRLVPSRICCQSWLENYLFHQGCVVNNVWISFSIYVSWLWTSLSNTCGHYIVIHLMKISMK